jgi:hypothetical protein
MTTVANLPPVTLIPVSLTPVANLPTVSLIPVSTTQAELVAKFATDVVDTGGKFVAAVVDTGSNFPVATPVVHLDLRISPQIFGKILNHPNVIFRGLGEGDS